jgi:hypothetical protein
MVATFSELFGEASTVWRTREPGAERSLAHKGLRIRSRLTAVMLST